MDLATSAAPQKNLFAGKFRPRILNGAVPIGGAGTIEVTDSGLRLSGHAVTGGFINFLLLLPVGGLLSWYLGDVLAGLGLDTTTIVMNFYPIFVGMFIIAALVLPPLVLKWKPITRDIEWRDVQILYPQKTDKPIVVGVLLDGFKRKKIHFQTRGPSYELEAAITQHPSFTPVHMF